MSQRGRSTRMASDYRMMRYSRKSAASKTCLGSCLTFRLSTAAWKVIVRDHKVQGVKVYDARLVAVMSVYAVESILTFNDVDFKRYNNITAIHPSSALA